MTRRWKLECTFLRRLRAYTMQTLSVYLQLTLKKSGCGWSAPISSGVIVLMRRAGFLVHDSE
jgi:hypothetical protein